MKEPNSGAAFRRRLNAPTASAIPTGPERFGFEAKVTLNNDPASTRKAAESDVLRVAAEIDELCRREAMRAWGVRGTNWTRQTDAIAAIISTLAGNAAGEKERRVPDGPACPTCGFKITTKQRPPFSLDSDDVLAEFAPDGGEKDRDYG